MNILPGKNSPSKNDFWSFLERLVGLRDIVKFLVKVLKISEKLLQFSEAAGKIQLRATTRV